jgi:hypothetical protein
MTASRKLFGGICEVLPYGRRVRYVCLRYEDERLSLTAHDATAE